MLNVSDLEFMFMALKFVLSEYEQSPKLMLRVKLELFCVGPF